MTEEELPELKKLYEKLWSDAMEVAKDLSMAKRVYRIVGIVSVIFGAVPRLWVYQAYNDRFTLFDWSFPQHGNVNSD